MNRLTLNAPVDGWVCPLDEVPDPVFAGRMLGDGLAIDPLGDTLVAPAAGTVVNVHEAGHAVTLRLAGGIELLLHFGLDTVRLGGKGFTPLVSAGMEVAVGHPLLKVDIGAIAGLVPSLVTPMVVVESGGWTVTEATSGRVQAGDAILVLTSGGMSTSGPAGQSTDFVPEASQEVRVPLAHGLHARPCATLAETARGFDADVRIAAGSGLARLRSPTAVLALGIRHGDTVTVQARGPDAQAAIVALATAIAGGMGEGAPFAAVRAEVRVADRAPAVLAESGVPPIVEVVASGTILSGVCAAPGCAVGPAWRVERPEPPIADNANDPAAERTRFEDARIGLRAELAGGSDGSTEAIMAAHAALLEDEDILERTHAAIAAGASAARAWRQVMHGQADALRALSDARFAERANDLLDLELRLQWRLAGQEMPSVTPPEGAIIVADDLMPSQVAGLDPERVGGIATARGGATSHVAIIAASRGIPALVAMGESVLGIVPGTMLVLDAASGTLDVDPGAARLDEVAVRRERAARRKAAALAAAGEEGRTADGVRIEVFANLGNRLEVPQALVQGAEGCGLLRTEFLFLDRANAPDEAEQVEEYAAIAQGLGGRPLIVRLLDIGGDKPAPYLPIPAEENPALGLRGIRVGLAERDVLHTQLRAILKAGTSGDVRIMAPMIARVEELRAVRSAMNAEAEALGLAQGLPLGIMVETPAAAIMADRFAAECDFLSIGSNDLTQYTLAMDRGNPAVAGSIDGLDPAVLRMIERCCHGANQSGKWVGVCGGLASDPLAVPILIGLGVTELSAAPSMVAEIKAVVRSLSIEMCRELAARATAASTSAEVRMLVSELGDLDR